MDRGHGEHRLERQPPEEIEARWTRLPEVEGHLGPLAPGTATLQWRDPAGTTVIGSGVAAAVEAAGPSRFAAVRRQIGPVFDSISFDGPAIARPRAIGGAAFDHDHEPTGQWEGFPAAKFVIPRTLVTRSTEGTFLTVLEEPGGPTLEELRDKVRETGATSDATRPTITNQRDEVDRDGWCGAVRRAIDRIEQDALEKVVIANSRRLTLDRPVEPTALLDTLGGQYPDCYQFLIEQAEGATFLGVPPERLVAKRGDRVETEALAGSAPRGETPERDEQSRTALLEQEEDSHEHGIVVDSITERLEPLAASVSIGDRSVRQLATVQHLETPITASGVADRHVLEVVAALHPTPAVGGVPPDAALATIRELESFDRGWYTGPVGWFDAAGDGEFAVGIRAGLVAGETVDLFAGNGIVAESDPAEEWTELGLKFQAVHEGLE